MDLSFWRKCSSCKKPIGFRQIYQKCNVSTCNQGRTSLVFCSVPCWSAHVPVYRHRDSWALEDTSPSVEEWTRQSATASVENAPPPRAILVREGTSAPVALKAASSDEVLVVVSKLKNYIRERSEMNTSADVIDVLSEKIRRLCDQAIAQARSDGRKTVMGRDF